MRPNGVVLYQGPSRLDGKPIVVIITGLRRSSRNEKTGVVLPIWIIADNGVNPVAALMSGADKSICGNCKHRPRKMGKQRKLGSCYVNVTQAPLAIHRAYKRGSYPVYNADAHDRYIAEKTVRFGAYGDPAAVPYAIFEPIRALANNHVGYTHQWKRCDQRLKRVCMASVDSAEERKEALAMGWRTFRVRTESEAVLPGEFICPASAEAGKRKSCAECKACSGVKSNPSAACPTIIVHGLPFKMKNFERLELGMSRVLAGKE